MVSAEVTYELAYFHLHPDYILVVVPILFVLTTLAISLRVYVRGFLIRSFGLDDWLLLAAYFVFVADCAIYIDFASTQKNEGLLGPQGKLGQLIVAGIVTYLMDQVLLKMSLAVFFLRIVNERWQKVVILTVTSIYVAYTFAFFWIAMFQYGVPTRENILAGNGPVGADVFKPMNYISACLNIIVDWVLTMVPIAVIWTAMMPKKAKISVCFLILLGALGSVASVARLPFIGYLSRSNVTRFFAGISSIALMSIAETALGIIAISLATLRPLFSRCIDATTRKGTTKKSDSDRQSHLLGMRSHGITRKTEVDIKSTPNESLSARGSEDALNLEELKQPVSSSAPLDHHPHNSGLGLDYGHELEKEDV